MQDCLQTKVPPIKKKCNFFSNREISLPGFQKSIPREEFQFKNESEYFLLTVNVTERRSKITQKAECQIKEPILRKITSNELIVI